MFWSSGKYQSLYLRAACDYIICVHKLVLGKYLINKRKAHFMKNKTHMSYTFAPLYLAPTVSGHIDKTILKVWLKMMSNSCFNADIEFVVGSGGWLGRWMVCKVIFMSNSTKVMLF